MLKRTSYKAEMMENWQKKQPSLHQGPEQNVLTLLDKHKTMLTALCEIPDLVKEFAQFVICMYNQPANSR